MRDRIVLELDDIDVLALIGSLELTISTYGKIGEEYRSELIALKQRVCTQLRAQSDCLPFDIKYNA